MNRPVLDERFRSFRRMVGGARRIYFDAAGNPMLIGSRGRVEYFDSVRLAVVTRHLRVIAGLAARGSAVRFVQVNKGEARSTAGTNPRHRPPARCSEHSTNPQGEVPMSQVMTAQQAVEALQPMKNVFRSLEHLEQVLATAANAEQVAREAEARRGAAEADLLRIQAQVPEAQRVAKLALDEITKEKEAAKADFTRFQGEIAAQRKALQAEMGTLVEQRDALTAAVKTLKSTLAKAGAAVTAS